MFKDENHYLTAEGYPLGTTCWYYRAEVNGFIQRCCAETKNEAWRITIQFVQQELLDTMGVS
jgi:hypothetical protein